MRIPPKLWRILGIGLALLILAGLMVRQWVVPGMIARGIETRYDGKVVVAGWWLGRTSGITGLSLRESDDPKSPVWATAESIATDLSLRDLLTGKVMPRTITLHAPSLTFRLNADGSPATKVPIKGGQGRRFWNPRGPAHHPRRRGPGDDPPGGTATDGRHQGRREAGIRRRR